MNILLVPSATLINKELQNTLGKIPSVLYPLEGRPVLDELYDRYMTGKIADSMYIVTFENADLISNYIKLKKKVGIHVVKLDQLKDLGYSVYFGLHSILSEGVPISKLYINFADTLISNNLDAYDNIIYYSFLNYNETWTYFTEANGQILSLQDKQVNHCEHAEIIQKKAFVGVFKINRPQCFHELLEQTVRGDSGHLDSFYQAVCKYSVLNRCQFLSAENWVDTDHQNSDIKLKTGVASRSFNQIRIDQDRGILFKYSDNKEKLRNEIKWYIHLPSKLQYLIPRIYEYSLSQDNPYVSMEYYSYKTLHEIYIFGNVPLYCWKQIFEKLKLAIQDMRFYKPAYSITAIKQSIESMYIVKTMERISKLKTMETFQPFFDKPVIINGISYLSLNQYTEQLTPLVNRLLVKYAAENFCIIHGDLCFSNILIDGNYGFIRLIDPRGEFGTYDIYGDQRYELAKILHSLEGGYDLIIEDMFSVEVNQNKITFEMREVTAPVKTVFLEVFKEYLNGLTQIRLIEALLFISMIPLHSDSVSRQVAMLATGIKLLDYVIKDDKTNGAL